jgi:hypothetical protein
MYGVLPQQLHFMGINIMFPFVDFFSRFTWLYRIQCKSYVYSVLIRFQAMVERMLSQKIKTIQTDWGGEY